MAVGTAFFSEPNEFEAATLELGNAHLCLTGPGPFRARLTQVALGSLRLWAVDERPPCIAFFTVATDTVLVTLPLDRSPVSIWGGTASHPDEFMTHGPGGHAQLRTVGPCRWGAIWMPIEELLRYGHSLLGDPLILPAGTRSWRPPAAAFRTLRALHAACVHAVERRPEALAQTEATHGFRQQLIHALVECLSDGPATEATPALRGRQDIAVRFDALLRAQPEVPHRPDSIAAALGVSRRYLGVACREQLGMGPAGFIRLHRMHLAHRDLRDRACDGMKVFEVARRYGFHDLGRFTRLYQGLFDELPSATQCRAAPLDAA
jgi:AraC-like DNA-binding protein